MANRKTITLTVDVELPTGFDLDADQIAHLTALLKADTELFVARLHEMEQRMIRGEGGAQAPSGIMALFRK